ncbi:MAG: DUF2889 domain-containing protein [Desulfobacter sp.]|nr:MAG: DUF2889 domain-containing protein [Desulfobacter sp.]
MLKDIIQTHSPIHCRNICLSTMAQKANQIIVHGELKDKRRIHIIDILGRDKAPGTIHHMSVTLLIALDRLRIIQAEAEMLTTPMAECAQTLDCMDRLINLEIKPGFSKSISTLVGGPNGCAHLCTLVTAMGTEIVHGGMAWKQHQDPDRKIPLQNADTYLFDSCRMWKKNGPKHRELVQAIKKENKTSGGTI